jgi:hypothetical protein
LESIAAMPEHADAFIVRSPKTESVEKLDGCQQEGEIVGERQQSSAETCRSPALMRGMRSW